VNSSETRLHGVISRKTNIYSYSVVLALHLSRRSLYACCFVLLHYFSSLCVLSQNAGQHQRRGLKTLPSPLSVRMCRCRRLRVQRPQCPSSGSPSQGWNASVWLSHCSNTQSYESATRSAAVPRMDASSVYIVETGVRPVT
jgi:hypothetical protein